VGDGKTLCTAAIQQALDACSETGGGIVYLPAGVWLSGALFLHSHTTLEIGSGAILRASQNPQDYPVIEARWEGRQQPSHAPLIGGTNLVDVTIRGSGVVDGNGAYWWERYRSKSLEIPRPRLISFADCRRVRIQNVELINSPSWTVNPVRCDDLLIEGITIRNPWDSPNTDGINPDSCSNVRIANCYISVGDDCITLKSGIETEEPALRQPCQNIAITNCIMADGHGGVVIGSEMSGDVRNVVIANCIFRGTDRGIRLKSRRGRGGVIEDVRISNILMTDVLCPLAINLYYACGRWGDGYVSSKAIHEISSGTPRIRGIHISNISVRGAKLAAAFIYGLPEMPIDDLSIADMQVELAADAEPGYAEMADEIDKMARHGFFVRNARRVRLRNIQIAGQAGAAFDLGDIRQLEIDACGTSTPDGDHAILHMVGVADAFVHGCAAPNEASTLLHVEGSGSAMIRLSGTVLEGAATPIRMGAEVQDNAISLA
jgi:polygalacturonase